MKLNLRTMAEDGAVFRFESDEDKREFWELYIKNDGSKYSNRSLTDILMQDNSTNFKVFVYYNEIFYCYSNNSWKYPTWTEIRGKYMKNNEIEKLAKNIYKALSNSLNIITENELNKAKVLLEKNGYKIESPYTPPTDSEIIARINAENKKVGYVPDWNDDSLKSVICYGHDSKTYYNISVCESDYLGAIYTTYEIAQQIVAELNEKRFVRVD